MKIWLDDQREPPDGKWFWCKDSRAFVSRLSLSITDASFDFDLGISADGYECAKLLIQYFKVAGIYPPAMFCHSQNPVGRERIERLIAEAQ